MVTKRVCNILDFYGANKFSEEGHLANPRRTHLSQSRLNQKGNKNELISELTIPGFVSTPPNRASWAAYWLRYVDLNIEKDHVLDIPKHLTALFVGLATILRRW